MVVEKKIIYFWQLKQTPKISCHIFGSLAATRNNLVKVIFDGCPITVESNLFL
jgi:hypothetical protein